MARIDIDDIGPRLAAPWLPTPLTRLDPSVDPDRLGGVHVWIKRDDLTGPAGGGNKARKLAYLLADARRQGAAAIVTVGAAQSNHCRMTAAMGAAAGFEVHLVLAGDKPDELTGNQRLSALLGAQLHFSGADDRHWGELEIQAEIVVDQLRADGVEVYRIPVGGSTPTGCCGYVAGFIELMQQCHSLGVSPTAVLHASSSGGTHAGLLAGSAAWRTLGHDTPAIVGVGVARGVIGGLPDIAELANATLQLAGLPGTVSDDDVMVDGRWIGDDYAVPSTTGDAAIVWAARNAGLILDRTYSGKGFAGLLGGLDEREWTAGQEVVFIHTGGLPAVFAPNGSPVG